MESTFDLAVTLEDVIYTTDAVALIGEALKHIGVKCKIAHTPNWDVVLYDSLSEIKEGKE